jgi:hypothetical protein
MTDPIVDKVVRSFRKRSKVGIEKYGMTLKANDDGTGRFLQHLQEELMDATLYIEKLRDTTKHTVEWEMVKLYHALLLAQESAGDKPLFPCDVEDVFFQCGHNIDELEF